MQNIVWIADEFKKHEHDRGWYAGLFLMGTILIGWGLYTNNLIATLLFVLIVFTLYVLSHKDPDKIRIEISPQGVHVNEIFHPYHSLNGFWLMYDPPHLATLNFETKKGLNRHLIIELEEQDPEDIRDYLLHFLPEETDYEERFIDFLVRKLKL